MRVHPSNLNQDLALPKKITKYVTRLEVVDRLEAISLPEGSACFDGVLFCNPQKFNTCPCGRETDNCIKSNALLVRVATSDLLDKEFSSFLMAIMWSFFSHSCTRN